MNSLVNYKLITNKICITNNQLSDGKFNVDPQIHRTIENIDDSHSAVTYVLEIKNTDDHPFPVNIEVSVTGIFDVGNLDKSSVDDFLKIQTCQILFPQIRTIVSSVTSAALMPPLMLPIIDARTLFSDDNSEKKK